MKKYLSLLVIAGMAIGLQQQAQAQNAPPAPHKPAKKSAEKKAAIDKSTDEDDKQPDISASTGTDFHCELGNKLTIYQNAADDRHIALRWNKRLHWMSRIDTSTGANRFENRKIGLVWINIPTKGMLLDSKKGHQLANECRSVHQNQDMTKG